MKNYLNRIYNCRWLSDGQIKAYSSLFCYMKPNGVFIYDTSLIKLPIVKEILQDFYNFEEEIKPNLIKYIDNNIFDSEYIFYYPIRELTEEEIFYIVMKYGDIGKEIIKEME